MEEFNYRGIFKTILIKWWIIVSIVLIITGAAVIYNTFFIQPVYESNTSLYVGKNIDSEAAVAYNDLLLGDSLVNDYRELIKSRLITSIVIRNLKLKMTPQSLAGKLNIKSKKDTRLITISVKDNNPKLARDIASEVAYVFGNKVVEIMEVKNLQIIDVPEISKIPLKPNIKMNIVTALVLSTMLGIGVAIIIDYMNNTIVTSEDVKKYTGLDVIGVIPRLETKQ